MLPYLLILIPGTAWVTGNLLLGAIVARALFSHAPAPQAPVGSDQISRAMAGGLFGDCLAAWYGLPLSLLCLLVCLGLGWWSGRQKMAGRRFTSLALLLTFVVLTLLHVQTTATIHQVGALAVSMASASGADLDELRLRFLSLHHASERLVLLETGCVLTVVVATAVAAVRRFRAPPTP